MSILSAVNQDALLSFLNQCSSVCEIDIEEMKRVTIEYLKRHDRKVYDDVIAGPVIDLEKEWYNSLNEKIPAYYVYESPYYFSEVWVCWSRYSRRYLKDIQLSSSLPNNVSIVNYMKDINNVLDLGCGFGYTTVALREIFKDANIFGTNIKDSYQYRMAEKLSRSYNFKIFSDYKNIECDLIFASEYFEHFDRPIEHLIDVIESCKPKYMLIANSFGPKAIGHFDFYFHGNRKYPAKEMSKMFNNKLKDIGYKKVKTNCWNNRPTFYERLSDDESNTSSLYNI
jgi:SAM-dependent methyltransferase